MQKAGRKWTKAELEGLKRGISCGKKIKELAQEFDRSERAVRVKLSKLGLRREDFVLADYNAKCPFFQTLFPEGGICCEGFGKASAVVCIFNDLVQRRNHFFTYCAEDYEHCPLAKIIFEKYK